MSRTFWPLRFQGLAVCGLLGLWQLGFVGVKTQVKVNRSRTSWDRAILVDFSGQNSETFNLSIFSQPCILWIPGWRWLGQKKTGHVQLMSTLVIRILPGWRLAQVGPLQFLVAPLSFTGTLGTMCHAWFVGSRGLQACLYKHANNYKHIMTYHDPVVCVAV